MNMWLIVNPKFQPPSSATTQYLRQPATVPWGRAGRFSLKIRPLPNDPGSARPGRGLPFGCNFPDGIGASLAGFASKDRVDT